ncbi:MAG: nuclear transport factor 2 family protein [Phycisphaerales bacterium]|nr:MAG: nuclear transport factor 2 family protein [Phycisphaerales bacterium]
MLKTVVAAVLPVTLFVLSGSEAGKSDLEAIKQTALDYGQGWYEGNAQRMERALHPDLAKRALMPDPRTGKGKIDHMSAMALVQATRKGMGAKTPTDQRRTHVTVLDVSGNAASVKLEMHDWVDYMHMSKTQGRWVIVNVLWELTAEAKKKYGIPDEL